ncbi:MAG: copper ion binding protein [Acidimicrobiia bacterium]|nr:copper ion binding protein [Acidimicrobiia bacterium]MDH3397230.1 copper ion binding protein [Acidimicrobiia bacterium]MDH5615082.1 copper ion binding protein [Acidimicrobiia bacterium]
MTTQSISVPDISCNHCKMSIEGAVGALSGVDKVEVHIEPRTVDVEYDDQSVSIDAIYAAIQEQGYEVATA